MFKVTEFELSRALDGMDDTRDCKREWGKLLVEEAGNEIELTRVDYG